MKNRDQHTNLDNGVITPANISHWMKALKEGESLEFSNGARGLSVRIVYYVNGKKRISNIKNRIFFGLEPLSLSSTSLVAAFNDPLKTFSKFGNEKKYTGKDRRSRGEKDNDVIRASMLMELSSMKLEDASPVETHHGRQWEFVLFSGAKLRVTSAMNPIALIKDGDMIYL